MTEYVSVLDSVICLSEIRLITVLYQSCQNYAKEWMHTLFVKYKDGTQEEFITADLKRAEKDYENLRKALLNYGIIFPWDDEEDSLPDTKEKRVERVKKLLREGREIT